MNPPVSIKKKVHTLAYLENAYEIEYTQALDTVSTCSIRLPADDPKAKYLDPNNLIEIEDNGESVGLFWIEQIIKVKEANSIYYNIIGYHAINSPDCRFRRRSRHYRRRRRNTEAANKWTGILAGAIMIM